MRQKVYSLITLMVLSIGLGTLAQADVPTKPCPAHADAERVMKAALGQSVVSAKAEPIRIRQAINVESAAQDFDTVFDWAIIRITPPTAGPNTSKLA